MRDSSDRSTTPPWRGIAARGEVLQVLRVLRGQWVAILVFSMVANLLMLVPTLYMLQVYDRVLASRSVLTLLAVSLMTLFLLTVMAFTEWARSRLLVRIGARLDELLARRVYTAAFASTLRGPRQGTAEALEDLTELRQFLTGPGIFAFLDLPWTPLYLAVLFLLHPLVGWLGVGCVMVQAALAWLGHQRTVAPSQALAQSHRHAQSFVDGLRGAQAIEAMGMLAHLQARWAQLHAHAARRHAAAHGLIHRIAAWSRFVRYAQQSLALAAGALLVIDGQLSAGGMIAINVLMVRALAPIDQLVSAWRGLALARGAWWRLEMLMVAHAVSPSAIAALPGLQPLPPVSPALDLPPLGGMVELRKVDVAVPGRIHPILAQVNLQAGPGTLTVVLGPSGSGKSTLARVLVGVCPATGGGVWLDGRSITEWTHDTLGPQVGYLPQDTVLFAGTVAQNIARFAPVDASGVIAAAQRAGLHEMVLRFPKGYDTPIGEGGHRLSGGQRQRIGLARALVGDPALVVLDEPNAHLDEAGEAALLEALRQLKARGKTVFVVAHRGGVLALADQVVALRDGRVLHQGPRDSVLAQMRDARRAALHDAARQASTPQPA